MALNFNASHFKATRLLAMPIPKLKSRQTRVYGELSAKRPPDRTNGLRVNALRARSWARSFFAGSWRKWLVLGITVLGGLLIVGAIFVLAIAYSLPDPSKLSDRDVAQSTKIYDRTGQHLLYEVFHDQKRTVIGLKDMSPWVSKATIAIEDKFFYQHSGVRVASIIRAGFNDLIGRRRGGGGASTLTQQLVKLTIVGDQHSLIRKIKEAILALQLERKYSKDEILALYLNEIFYGSTNYGVEEASQSYFHKSAKNLTLGEAAVMAALPKAPSRYLNNPTALKDRRDAVLRLMNEQGYITEVEKNMAQNAPLPVLGTKGIFNAPHFVLYVKQLLADQFGERLVDTGGLKVITSLDFDKQQLAERLIKENGDKFAKSARANNAAMVAIDPLTGQILAMVGSRDFTNVEIDGQFNVVTQGKLQPGSSLKPFIYTAAFEKGYTPDTILYDVKTDFDLRTGGAKYSPNNYDGKERGLVTMRKALQGSLNIPAVKTMYLVGYKNTIEFLKRFGYTTFTGDYGLSLVLGGGEVNLLEHTNAYATLADNGQYHDPVSILSVENATGAKLLEWNQTPGKEAVPPELAATITNVLTDNAARVYVFGEHNNLVLPDRPVAAKTGTTQSNKDAWTMGYVPSLAVGVWVGNTPKHVPMKAGGNQLAGAIWNQFMVRALKKVKSEQFPTALPNDAKKPILRGSDGGIKLLINKLNGRMATSSTPPELLEEHTYLPPHDILFYVQKDDPRGETPAYPGDDPQYENWERALQDWIAREQKAGKPQTLSEPPTEYDIIASSTPELAPRLIIIAPTPGQVFATRSLSFQVQATAPRGISEVEYFVDNKSIGTQNQFPFTFAYDAALLPVGPHTLRVIAKDDLGNNSTKEVGWVLAAI